MASMTNQGEPPSEVYLPMGVRAWTPDPSAGGRPKGGEPGRSGRGSKRRYPNEALVFDIETRDEPGQRLLFGVWRLYVDILDTDPATRLVEEGIFYPRRPP